MKTYTSIETSNTYRPLQDWRETAESDIMDKIRIETVLILVHSLSNKYQLRVLLIYCLGFFFVGFHIFTFHFVFLSPDFYLKGELKSKIVE